MPDDDSMLAQGTVDARNEQRNPLNARDALPPVFYCFDPEQDWIEESRADHEREDPSHHKEKERSE